MAAEYETAFDEPAQSTMERMCVVSAREGSSIGAAHAELAGRSFGTRRTRRGRAGELVMSATHRAAMPKSRGATRVELLPVCRTLAALPLVAHGAAARVDFRSRRRSPDRLLSSLGGYPASRTARNSTQPPPTTFARREPSTRIDLFCMQRGYADAPYITAASTVGTYFKRSSRTV
jgi:hypothetical protein